MKQTNEIGQHVIADIMSKTAVTTPETDFRELVAGIEAAASALAEQVYTLSSLTDAPTAAIRRLFTQLLNAPKKYVDQAKEAFRLAYMARRGATKAAATSALSRALNGMVFRPAETPEATRKREERDIIKGKAATMLSENRGSLQAIAAILNAAVATGDKDTERIAKTAQDIGLRAVRAARNEETKAKKFDFKAAWDALTPDNKAKAETFIKSLLEAQKESEWEEQGEAEKAA